MLDGEALGEFIDAHFTSTLFRLETLNHYEEPSEAEDFRAYLAGQPGPLGKQAWTEVIRGEVARGLHTYRVHVVRSPLSDYLRYECEWGYVFNAEAGEHIRILDTAERPNPAEVPDEDFWLIGDEHLVLMHYHPDGTFAGASVGAPELLPRYITARDAAWSASIDFDVYWREHPQYHRDQPAA